MNVQGSSFTVRNSYFHDNGYEEGHNPNSWADGLTVQSCFGCWIHDNVMSDNTDIGLVVGGGYGTVEDNDISNEFVHAFAGMHIGWFPPGGGDHSGMTYDSNTIHCDEEDMMAFGLIIGYEPWFTGYNSDNYGFVDDAGYVTNNTIEGAVVNLAIDGIGDGYVDNNSVSNNRGIWGFNNCSISRAYTAHFFGDATIQADWEAWFFTNGCNTWDTAKPRIDDEGSLARDMALQINVPLWSNNHAYYLILQSDGNLVLYDQYNSPQWWTGTTTGNVAQMQMDGNFVLNHNSSNLFNTGTSWWPGCYLVVQNDGNLVVYSPTGSALWDIWS
jgi:hypothetical protein